MISTEQLNAALINAKTPAEFHAVYLAAQLMAEEAQEIMFGCMEQAGKKLFDDMEESE